MPRKKRLPGVGDLVGGYINPGTERLSIPFRLLTSKDSDHYYAKFNTSKSYNQLCDILTSMQSIPFMVNQDVLSFIEENMSRNVEAGLLMPPFLDRVHPSRLRRALQQFVKSGW